MSKMSMVRDMVWAVLLGDALPKHGLAPDQVTVDCNTAAIWLKDLADQRLAEHRRADWWEPPTLGTVEAIAASLALQLDRRAKPAIRRRDSMVA
jgi:hypothetical protein